MAQEWPEITEQQLRERQAMSDAEFLAFLRTLLEAIGTRELEEEHYERAVGYPWARPAGSFFVTDQVVERLADMDVGRREARLANYLDESTGRIRLLAYGANGSPERLALKLAHLPDGHREALVLAGDLEDFDVGAAAQPPLFSSMPATLIPSRGSAVRVAVLFLTQIQFTALWWTELSYKLGALTSINLTADLSDSQIDRVMVFISRYGAFCVEGAPIAMAALEARNRRSVALTQIEILDAAARVSLGQGANAHDLVKAAFENPAAFMAAHYASFQAASVRFKSKLWTELPVE